MRTGLEENEPRKVMAKLVSKKNEHREVTAKPVPKTNEHRRGT